MYPVRCFKVLLLFVLLRITEFSVFSINVHREEQRVDKGDGGFAVIKIV
jgi:hypothetical protein